MWREVRLGGRFLVGSVLLCLLAAGLAGCWDFREPNKMGFVEALAVDRTPDGHVDLCALVAIPGAQPGTAGGGGGGTPKLPALMEKGHGRTLAEALLDLNRFTSRALTTSQCRVVLFSEEIARRGFTPYLGFLTRWFEFRRTLSVAVTKGRADESLKIESPLERDPALFLVGLLGTARGSGFAGAFQLQDVLNQMGSYDTETVVPVIAPTRVEEAAHGGGAASGRSQEPRKAAAGPGEEAAPPKSAVELRGLAVLRTGRMVGELSLQEAPYFLMLSGVHLRSYLFLPDPRMPGRYVTVEMKGTRRRVRVKRLHHPPELELSLEVPLELVEIQSTVDYSSRKLRGLIERAAAEQISRATQRLVAKAQREFRADIFGWGTFFKLHFADWPAWSRYDWLHKQFPRTRVTINVTARLRRPGVTFRPLKPASGPSLRREEHPPADHDDHPVQDEQAYGAPAVAQPPGLDGVDGGVRGDRRDQSEGGVVREQW